MEGKKVRVFSAETDEEGLIGIAEVIDYQTCTIVLSEAGGEKGRFALLKFDMLFFWA
jgi:hypothetical protein